jgi:GLPGLI family protein
MKFLLITCLFFLAKSTSYSQQNDNNYTGMIEYTMSYKKSNGEFNEVLFIKTFFNKKSHYFKTSNTYSNSEANLTDGFKSIGKDLDSFDKLRMSKDLKEQIKNLEPLKEFVFYEKKLSAITTQLGSDKYLVTDSLFVTKYEITADTMTINQFKCQKAIFWYNNQKTEVWFTLEIPYQVGPLKWYGLPGAILKIVSNEGKQIISFSKIEYPLKTPIKIDFNTYKVITKKEKLNLEITY